MKDFYGMTVKIGDYVLFTQKSHSSMIRGKVVEIVGDKAKIKGQVMKRKPDEIISEVYYLEFLDQHPEFFI